MIWNGVPWEVSNIGLQATLVNPLLGGGQLQLPLGVLIGKHSRPVVENEPWFPSQAGDWVTLSDDTYGRVEQQTMEQVILKLKGNTLKFYPTPEFLGATPMNLSKGFRYSIEFGLDYSVQPRICDEIPKIFEKGLRKHLNPHYKEGSPDFIFTKVSFDNAGSSSLNLKIIIDVEGRCAENYEDIQRSIQSTLVRICNENNLTIPFNQLTVTLPENLQPKKEREPLAAHRVQIRDHAPAQSFRSPVGSAHHTARKDRYTRLYAGRHASDRQGAVAGRPGRLRSADHSW